MKKIDRRSFMLNVSKALPALFLLGGASCRQKIVKPNILFVLADDLGWPHLGCYGSSFYETPTLDKLATEGMRFTDAYAAHPVCSPTRASIMTGKYPARLHITDYIPGNGYPHKPLKTPDWQKFLPLEEETIAEMVKQQGYATASFGKWHLSIEKRPPASLPYNPDQQGFDENIVTYKPNRQSDPENDAHNVHEITRKSVDFIQRHKDDPFFLYVTHNTVHDPLMENKERVEYYENKAGSELPENNPTVAAMLETLDRTIGEILTEIDNQGLRENTLVVFFSDNGGLERSVDQAPLRGGKATLYEGGIRVPMIVRWPDRIEANSVSREPVTSVDFFSTFYELVNGNTSPNPNLDGTSLLPVLLQTGRQTAQ